MAKRSLAMQFDEVVQAMLVSLQPRPEEAPDRELAPLLRVAQALGKLPRPEFRARLKSGLQRRATMNKTCTKCKKEKKETAFPLTKVRGKMLRRSWCDSCMKVYYKAYALAKAKK